jgi:hypothetical protein
MCCSWEARETGEAKNDKPSKFGYILKPVISSLWILSFKTTIKLNLKSVIPKRCRDSQALSLQPLKETGAPLLRRKKGSLNSLSEEIVYGGLSQSPGRYEDYKWKFSSVVPVRSPLRGIRGMLVMDAVRTGLRREQ